MPQVDRFSEVEEPWCLDVVLAEHDGQTRTTVTNLLRGAGHRVHTVHDEIFASLAAGTHPVDLIIADLDHPSRDGFSLVARLRNAHPHARAILCCETPSIEDALAATRARAEYLIKPLRARNLLGPVSAIARRREERTQHLDALAAGDSFVARSPVMLSLLRDAREAAANQRPLLILGEVGTGKRLLAKYVHAASDQAERIILDIDCAALDSDQVLSVLSATDGLIRKARGTSLLLCNVDALPLTGQALLAQQIAANADSGNSDESLRPIATTSRDLRGLVATGRFRCDLAEQLLAQSLKIPPLRRRIDDIPLLVEQFCLSHGGTVPRFATEVWSALAASPFANNVQELRQVIAYALAHRVPGEVGLECLPARSRHRWCVPKRTDLPILAPPKRGTTLSRVRKLVRSSVARAIPSVTVDWQR